MVEVAVLSPERKGAAVLSPERKEAAALGSYLDDDGCKRTQAKQGG